MNSAKVKSEATRWLIELETSDEIETHWPAFEEWLDRDPEHRRTYVRVERAWRILDEVLRMSLKDEKSLKRRRGPRPSAPFGRGLLEIDGRWAIQIGFAILAALLFALWMTAR